MLEFVIRQKGSAENRTSRNRPRARARASTSTTEHLCPTQLLIDPCHPTRKRVAIKRARPIRVALIPTTTNKQTHRDAALFQRCKKITVKLYTHQRPRNRCGSSLDLSHITLTIRPSSLASGPGSAGPSGGGGGAGAGDAGMGGGTSMESPRQPAFWRFAGVGVGGGGGLGACARTLAINSAS